MNQRYNLDQLLDDRQSIYVMNESGKAYGTKGVVHISFVDTASGKTKPFTIPSTWLPICITDAIPSSILRHSMDLRNYLGKGFLRIVNPVEAEKILNSPEAKDELTRLMNIDKSFRNLNINMANEQETTVLSPDSQARLQQGLDPITSEDRVNPRVRDILLRTETNDLTARMAVAELRSLASDLRVEDASYILANAKDGAIKKYGQQLLAEKQHNTDESNFADFETTNEGR